MKTYSDKVHADIARRSKTFGITLGLLCLPFAFVAGFAGSCCPLGAFIGVLPVASAGGLAGTLAAMFLNWADIPSEDALGVGARVGAKTAIIASIIGALTTFIVSLLSAGALGAAAAEGGSGSPGEFVAATGLLNGLILVLGIIPGVLFGTLGGVIGAAIKRPAAGPK